MVSIDTVRKLALAFEGSVELPHFHLTSFRTPKRIFATLDVEKKRVCLMLTPLDQSVFCSYDPLIIYPVPNKWGKGGATYVELSKVRKDIFKDALATAYTTKAKKKQ